jgi:hypothetical protein
MEELRLKMCAVVECKRGMERVEAEARVAIARLAELYILLFLLNI